MNPPRSIRWPAHARRPLVALTALVLLAGCAQRLPEAPRPGVPTPPRTDALPTNEDVRLLQEADALARKGQIDPALFRYDRLTEIFPDSPLATEAMVRMADIFLNRREEEKGIHLLKQAAARVPHPFAAQAATRLNEVLSQRGGADASWSFWSERLDSGTSGGLQGDEAWRQMLETYFAIGAPDNTPSLLHTLPPGGFSPEQSRSLFQLIQRLPEPRIQELLNLQPANSPLSPYLHIALGDRRAQAGAEEEAQQHWNSARTGDPLVAEEARARLSPDSQGAPLQVGLLLPLSGRYETLGENLLFAARSALTAFRDTPIQLLVEESLGTPDGARQGMTRLAAEGAQLVIGPVFHDEAAAAAETALNLGIPVLTLNPNLDIAAQDTRIGADRLVYLNAFQPDRQARFMASYAVQMAERRHFAILAPDSEYGRLTAESFRQEATRLGGQVGKIIFFTPEATDLSPWIKKLAHVDAETAARRKAAQSRVRTLDPAEPLPGGKSGEVEPWSDFDALFMPMRTEQARLAAPQLAFFNLRAPSVLLLGTALWNRPELLQEGTDYLHGAVFCDTESWPVQQYEADFKRIWGNAPSSLAMLLHDGVAAVAQLMRDQRMHGPDWRTGLTRMEGFMGASGRFRFLDNGSSERWLHYYHVEPQGIVSRSPRQEPAPPAPLALQQAEPPATPAPSPSGSPAP